MRRKKGVKWGEWLQEDDDNMEQATARLAETIHSSAARKRKVANLWEFVETLQCIAAEYTDDGAVMHC